MVWLDFISTAFQRIVVRSYLCKSEFIIRICKDIGFVFKIAGQKPYLCLYGYAFTTNKKL